MGRNSKNEYLEDTTEMKDQKNRMVNERDFRQDPNYVAPDPEKKKLLRLLQKAESTARSSIYIYQNLNSSE